MKRLNYLLVFLICIASQVLSQTQQKIPWPSLADSPWPILRGDAQGTGRSEFVGPSTANVIWVKDMPLGILYGPVIGYDDVLYMGTRANSAPENNCFYAVNPDGSDLWTVRTDTVYPNYGGAIIGNDTTIYFSSNDGSVFAVDKDGNKKWQSNYLRIGGGLGFSIAKNGDLYVTTYNDSLVVLDNTSGKIKTKSYLGENLYANVVTFSPDGEIILFTRSIIGEGFPHSLVAADLNGNILWSKYFHNTTLSPPVVDNSGNIYIMAKDTTAETNAFLFCINLAGETLWTFPVFTFSHFAAPTIDNNGNIIFISKEYLNGYPNDPANVVHSLNYNGELNWEYVIDPQRNVDETKIDHALVCDAEGKIYFGSTYGYDFYCLSKDGELLWRLDLEGNEYDSSPAIGSDGTLYIGSHMGSLNRSQTKTLIAVKDKPNSVEDEETPTEFNLEQNYPNPFNPSTIIKYAVVETSRRGGTVFLRVYDMLGREVATLVNETKPVGTYEVEFDGSKLTSGVYFYVLETGGKRLSRKMMLLK